MLLTFLWLTSFCAATFTREAWKLGAPKDQLPELIQFVNEAYAQGSPRVEAKWPSHESYESWLFVKDEEEFPTHLNHMTVGDSDRGCQILFGYAKVDSKYIANWLKSSHVDLLGRTLDGTKRQQFFFKCTVNEDQTFWPSDQTERRELQDWLELVKALMEFHEQKWLSNSQLGWHATCPPDYGIMLKRGKAYCFNTKDKQSIDCENHQKVCETRHKGQHFTVCKKCGEEVVVDNVSKVIKDFGKKSLKKVLSFNPKGSSSRLVEPEVDTLTVFLQLTSSSSHSVENYHG